MSWSGADVNRQVKYVRIPPATLASRPPVKRRYTTIRCLVGSCRFLTVFMGSRTMIKSVTVFMTPAARTCASSLMHFCLTKERVQ
jgi:hypothetical protein